MAEASYQASILRPAHAAGGSIGDFVALMKPRVMSLVVFTALVGMLLAPQQPHPALGVIAPRLHRRRRRSLGRAQHVVRRRHRRADAAHRKPSHPARPRHARRGPHLRHHPGHRLGRHAGPHRQLGGGRAVGLHHRLLRPRLYDVAEAAHAAEHRHRRRRRRLSADDRLGGGDGLGRPREPRPVRDHLHVDAAALLGARALSHARLRARRGADAARGGRRPTRRASRSSSTRRCWCRSRCGRPSSALPAGSTCWSPRRWAAIFLALALAVYRTREGREADSAARQLFAFSILYLFGLFATLLIERGMDRLARLIAKGRGTGGGRWTRRVGAAAQDAVDRHRARPWQRWW